MTKDPGYHNQDVLQIELGRDFQAYDAFLSDIRSLPEVLEAAGAMDGLPMRGWMTFMHPHFKDSELKIKMEGFAVDYGLLETLGLTLEEGRFFSPDFGSDLDRSVILNETAVRELGIEDPLGRMMQDSSVIIGVVKDFNLHSIHTEIPPLDIHLTDRYLYYILVHYRTGSLNSLLPKLEAEWNKVEPDRPLAAVPIEELFQEVYAAERNLTTIFSVASLFTLLIAAFGLFGLTLFMARSRTHEIGIRKTFGSPERAIVVSFLRSNFLMVVLAAGLSVPVTLYFMNRWLLNFSYRTDIGWWVFVLAFGIAAMVVLLTVSVHAIRASRVNPVDALRYE
jgi:putative ABC transport system permease protein